MNVTKHGRANADSGVSASVEELLARGNALRSSGQPDEAIEAYRAALAIQPDHAMSNLKLISSLQGTSRSDEAVAIARAWKARAPRDPVAIHTEAAIAGHIDIPRASDGYIKTVFDDFAVRFEAQMALLEYCGPTLVAAAAADVLGEAAGALDILDAGCGTGLCGPVLRPYARALVGVDLSTGMLAEAEKQGCYDRLEQGELTAFMNARPHAFDAVVCADTLIYFGDLAAPLLAAATTLRAGGYLIFTLESAQAGEPGQHLNADGRYRHTEAYVRQALAAAKLRLLSLTSDGLRYEGGPLVLGFIVTAQRAMK